MPRVNRGLPRLAQPVNAKAKAGSASARRRQSNLREQLPLLPHGLERALAGQPAGRRGRERTFYRFAVDATGRSRLETRSKRSSRGDAAVAFHLACAARSDRKIFGGKSFPRNRDPDIGGRGAPQRRAGIHRRLTRYQRLAEIGAIEAIGTRGRSDARQGKRKRHRHQPRSLRRRTEWHDRLQMFVAETESPLGPSSRNAFDKINCRKRQPRHIGQITEALRLTTRYRAGGACITRYRLGRDG